jgi:hypothetical protein
VNASELLKLEYDRLKQEQVQRIGFRDNLIYVSLAVSGVIFSYAFAKASHSYALLIVPFALGVLGWVYLVNDEKISAIGRYIRVHLSVQLSSSMGGGDVFQWEKFHRQDSDRVWRKRTQTSVDLLTFCAPGLLALIAFWVKGGSLWLTAGIAPIEFGITAFLGWAILHFSDHATN